MSQNDPFLKDLGGNIEATKEKRRSLFRSFSGSSSSSGPSAFGISRQAPVDEHNDMFRTTRKLRRRPSATSSSSRTSSTTATGSEYHALPPVPLSDISLNFQRSRTSAETSESGHILYFKGNEVPDLPQSASFLEDGRFRRRGVPHIIPPKNDALCHPLSPALAPEQLDRRKANMSKLMRHFGESRIPAELISAQPRPIEFNEARRLARLPKSKSLDLRPTANACANGGRGEGGGKSSLTRAYSLEVHRRQEESEIPPSGCGGEMSRKVKRTRKITKIFGPEVAHELMTMRVKEQRPSNGPDQDAKDSKAASGSSEPTLSPSSSSDITQLTYNLADGETGQLQPVDSEPPTPVLEQDLGKDRDKRVKKLANFFGVDHLTVSSSITVAEATTHPLSDSEPSFNVRQTLSSVTEIDVQISGRRFWGMSRVKGEIKNAQMADAIQQLRGLKAG